MVDVLIVDDEPGISRIVRLMLQSEGFDVEVKDRGSAALEYVEREAVGLVLLDINMPEMDGRELFRELRQRGFITPVILMSANGARAAARELGADAYLEKPFALEDLVSCVKKLA